MKEIELKMPLKKLSKVVPNGMQRRHFIKSFAVSVSGLTLTPFAKLIGAPRKLEDVKNVDACEADDHSSPGRRHVFIFQDVAHFDTSGRLEAYRPPGTMASTKEYLNGVDEKTYLARHWFV